MTAQVLAWAIMKDGECLAVRRFKPSPMSEQEGVEFVPLVPQRLPLSDGWILGMWPDTGFPHLVLKFARSLEATHGITGENNDQ